MIHSIRKFSVFISKKIKQIILIPYNNIKMIWSDYET
jgi:hypothetical protein